MTSTRVLSAAPATNDDFVSLLSRSASIWDTVQADSHREHLTKNRRYPHDQKYGSLTRFPRCTKREAVVGAREEERERERGEESRKEERQRRPKESADARDREHAKEEESAAFTRIPADPSKPPLRSARLTLRRASLQVGHATTHRSTLGRTLPSPLLLLVSSLSPFPPSLPPPPLLATTVIIIGAALGRAESTFSFAAVGLP